MPQLPSEPKLSQVQIALTALLSHKMGEDHCFGSGRYLIYHDKRAFYTADMLRQLANVRQVCLRSRIVKKKNLNSLAYLRSLLLTSSLGASLPSRL